MGNFSGFTIPLAVVRIYTGLPPNREIRELKIFSEKYREKFEMIVKIREFLLYMLQGLLRTGHLRYAKEAGEQNDATTTMNVLLTKGDDLKRDRRQPKGLLKIDETLSVMYGKRKRLGGK